MIISTFESGGRNQNLSNKISETSNMVAESQKKLKQMCQIVLR